MPVYTYKKFACYVNMILKNCSLLYHYTLSPYKSKLTQKKWLKLKNKHSVTNEYDSFRGIRNDWKAFLKVHCYAMSRFLK